MVARVTSSLPPHLAHERYAGLERSDLRRSMGRFVDWATDIRLRRSVMQDCAFPSDNVIEFLVVNQLAYNGPMRPIELANALSQTKTNISKVLKRVEDLGLIDRVPAREDGRGVLVVLTELGAEMGTRILARMSRDVDSVFHFWDADDVETLQRLLARLVRDLESDAAARARSER